MTMEECEATWDVDRETRIKLRTLEIPFVDPIDGVCFAQLEYTREAMDLPQDVPEEGYPEILARLDATRIVMNHM